MSDDRMITIRTPIAILLVVAVVAVLGGGGYLTVTLVQKQQDALTQRNLDVAPRYIDVWAVYPSNQVRFTTIFTPSDSNTDTSVSVAGPLVLNQTDVVSMDVQGGTLADTTYSSGLDFDADKVYALLTLARFAGSTPYGATFMTQNSPYITADSTDSSLRVLTLGAATQTYYEQVIVAVALMRQATVTSVGGGTYLQPYRERQVKGWHVYYFDTTSLTSPSAIQITYHPVLTTRMPAVDAQAINAHR